jgi:hypothetical protein
MLGKCWSKLGSGLEMVGQSWAMLGMVPKCLGKARK